MVRSVSRKILFSGMLIFMFATPVYSAPVFFSWGGEKIMKVMDFPNNYLFARDDNQYIDAGYRFQQISIFFIPVWNYNGHWCGYIGSTEQYIDLNYNDLNLLAKSADLKLPSKDNPPLTFWDDMGGKLLFGFIILLAVGYTMNEEEEEKKS